MSTSLPAVPVFMTSSDKPLDFHAVSACCRELTIALGKTHSFYIVRWTDDIRHGFSVLARRKKLN